MTKNKYSQLPVILIDQLSMVSNKLVMNAYRGPLVKFSCYPGVNFADISVIACGFFISYAQLNKGLFTPSLIMACLTFLTSGNYSKFQKYETKS